jgi:hypothetical protein
LGVEELPETERRQILRQLEDGPGRFDALALPPGAKPTVAIRRIVRWGTPAEDGTVLLSAGDRYPFLWSRGTGGGSAFAFSVPAERSWSNLPLSPLFLPVLHELVRRAAGMQDAIRAERVAVSVPLPDAIGDLDQGVLGPEGRTHAVRGAQGMADVRPRVEDALTPGIYRAPSGSTPPRPLLALNVDRAESNLARVDEAALAAGTGMGAVFVARNSGELQRVVAEHRTGLSLGGWLLWVAFALAVLELVVANRLSRREAALSEQLRVDPAGRVRTATP